VILSGGSGTRLWPLSTPDTPKQFSKLVEGQSLFELTLARLDGLEHLVPALVVTGERHLPLVEREVDESPIEVGSVIVEPEGRNTAPAVIAAALASAPEDILLILPSDHLVADDAGFRDAVGFAADLAGQGDIVTFGARPSRPETGYGYIEVDGEEGKSRRIERFKEKPDLSEAEMLWQDGRHFWNLGMFVVAAGVVLEEARRYCPDVVVAVESALESSDPGAVVRLGEGFRASPSISFDHAVMEHTERGLVVPISVGWDDIGSYRSLLEASQRDMNGNYIAGDVSISDVSGSFINATSRRVVVAGVENLIIVETPDVVLVLPIDRAQEVRDLQTKVED
jgi:mannose-1-phosphate guanylyltransferase / mannose-6-phosphate isomerase